ncbi:uncharacterized protein FMAN_03533 [Fusarium mangiferae]|uniref:C2H2-type domain-containing protein n=1 Tax=Fusarium mangiferae TaxID=192010 RepID=A0A1L7TCA6_FUSMA|nr:uncharacterized protein FMAN_03533 [Fusarium mangiferae]CVK94422.1 uncharacterized protein FMAN_03533 [Fusarium mangiferae]
MDSYSPNKEAISAVDGLLACLIYLDETGSEPTDPLVRSLRQQTGHYWESLTRLASTHTIPCFTALYNSFDSRTHFYEVAIFTFRNILVGIKPHSLNNIFPLCSLSYIASCCLQNHDNVFDIEVWRSAILDPEERQTFSNLAGIVWPQVPSILTDDPLEPQLLTLLLGASTYQNPSAQSSTLGFDFMQDESLLNDLSDPFLDFNAIPDSPVAFGIEISQPTSSSLQGLQGSAIVSNLISFLTECGDFLHVFSGRAVTTKDLYSCIAFIQGGARVKSVINTCLKRLKSDETSQSLSAVGILYIVERFVALGYLQTPEELRKYMLCVGRAVILEDEALAEFCQTVRETTATVSSPLTPPRGGGRRLKELRLIPRRVIPCEVCGRLFSRTYNKNRHVETKHPRSQLSPSANGLVQGSMRLTA